MGRQIGGKSEWQKLMKLVGSGELTIGRNTGFGAIPVEVYFDNQPDTPERSGSLSTAAGHAYYTVSCIVKQPGIKTYILGAGLVGYQFDQYGVYCAIFRQFVTGPFPDDPTDTDTNPRWKAGLSISNMTGQDVTLLYQAYRYLGLV